MNPPSKSSSDDKTQKDVEFVDLCTTSESDCEQALQHIAPTLSGT